MVRLGVGARRVPSKVCCRFRAAASLFNGWFFASTSDRTPRMADQRATMSVVAVAALVTAGSADSRSASNSRSRASRTGDSTGLVLTTEPGAVPVAISRRSLSKGSSCARIPLCRRIHNTSANAQASRGSARQGSFIHSQRSTRSMPASPELITSAATPLREWTAASRLPPNLLPDRVVAVCYLVRRSPGSSSATPLRVGLGLAGVSRGTL